MTLSVGELVGTLQLVDKGFTKGIDGAEGRMRRLGDTSEQTAQRSGASWKSMAVGVGAAFAAAKFADFAKQSIGAAAAAEQAVGGTAAVFGESAGMIDQAASRSATSLGLSERAFRDLTTVAGAQLKNLGFDVEDAAAKSIELTEIGADLAATYGGTTAEAVEALGAAFRGEADPAERFGLSLNVTAQNAKAVEMGLADSTAAVSAEAKAQATLALIMEQTTDAQGQFARESGTAAGQAAILTAQWEDMQAELGAKLLPVLTKVGQALSTVMGNDAALAAAGVGALSIGLVAAVGPMTTMVDHARTLGSGLQRLTTGFGGVGNAAKFMAGPTALLAAGVALDQYNKAQQNTNIERMTDEFLAAGESAKAMDEALDTLVGQGVTETIGAFEKLAETNRAGAERFIEQAEAAGTDSRVIDEMRGYLETTAAAQAQTAADTEVATEAIEGQVGATQDLVDAIDSLLSRFFSAEESMIAQQDAIAGVDEHLKEMREEYGRGAMSLDLNTEAGRRNREMLAELFTATGDTITAMRESGATSEEIRAQWALDRGELSAVIERFRAAGVDVSAYDAMLAQIDEVVATQVVVDNAAAVQRINEVWGGLLALDGTRATTYIDQILTQTTLGLYKPSGKRALGGPVSKGGVYEVTEGGIPELLVDGGRTYLMPGKGGHVETIDQAMTRMAGTVNTPAGGGGGGGTAHVVVTLDAGSGGDEIARWFRKAVRVEGRGDVQVAFGSN